MEVALGLEERRKGHEGGIVWSAYWGCQGIEGAREERYMVCVFLRQNGKRVRFVFDLFN